MKEGQIVNRLFVEKRGKMIEIVIRAPKRSDVREVWSFYNRVIRETPFLSRITPVPLSEEKKWLAGVLNKMKKKKAVQLLAEHDGKIVGSCSVEKGSEAAAHTGTYGICVLQRYTGCGLGTKMTEHVIALAKKEMKTEVLRLNVYHRNKIAQGLYKKMGFRYVGKIPNGRKRGRVYMDDIIMYKVLK
jgi:RimJ/RimL family protein N-acetyltransferase